MTTEARRIPRLPACKQCSQKKVKCDSNRPKCLLCTRNGIDCLILDSVSQEWVSRAYIDELEKLEERLNSGEGRGDDKGADGFVEASPANPSPEKIATVLSMGSSSTVARGGGLSFIALLFSDADWRRTNADLLRSLARAPRAPDTPIDSCPLPSATVVKGLFERYLEWSHVLSPYLMRREVWDLYQRVFSPTGEPLAASSHDLFRTFILCAISAVRSFRNGTHPQHPEGYYRASLQHLGPYFLTRGLDSIQDLLLIGRFGVYHHIGASIWDLTRICGRLCAEQGLHCGDGETGDLLQDQTRRRIFWQFYVIDRYSSTTLDRPFAIDDRDIEVDLPADADDDELVAANPTFPTLDAFRSANLPSGPNEMTVFLFCVRLRQISSRIHVELSRLRQDPSLSAQPHLAVGRICTTLNRLLQDLAAWRESAPTIQSPRCLYESQDWFDLLYSREKIGLVRRAVDLVPKSDGAPPRHVLALFLRTALQTIDNYASLSKRRAHITHTRAYFHMMFTAGLSVMYCTSVSPNLTHEDLLELSRGLRTCELTLGNMSEQLPDAYTYVTVFEALHRHIARKIQRALGNVDSHDEQVDAPAVQPPTALDIAGAFYQAQPQLQTTHDGAYQLPSGDSSGFTTSQDWDAGGAGFGMPLAVFGDPVASGGYDLRGNAQDQSMPGEDLLQWAFMNDESIWNMDMMLGEYVYGDPTNSGLLDGVDF